MFEFKDIGLVINTLFKHKHIILNPYFEGNR